MALSAGPFIFNDIREHFPHSPPFSLVSSSVFPRLLLVVYCLSRSFKDGGSYVLASLQLSAV